MPAPPTQEPPSGAPPGTPAPPVNSSPQQNQQVTQDNDITTNITGDGNIVNNNQDNSVRQYGGDNRSFTYVGGGGNGLQDTPVSAATMSGVLDARNDPAYSAQFIDQFDTMNRDIQKRNNQDLGYAQQAMDLVKANSPINVTALDKTIRQRPLYSEAKGRLAGLQVFGDTFNMTTPDWSGGFGTQSPVERPDFEGTSDDIYDRIDNVG